MELVPTPAFLQHKITSVQRSHEKTKTDLIIGCWLYLTTVGKFSAVRMYMTPYEAVIQHFPIMDNVMRSQAESGGIKNNTCLGSALIKEQKSELNRVYRNILSGMKAQADIANPKKSIKR